MSEHANNECSCPRRHLRLLLATDGAIQYSSKRVSMFSAVCSVKTAMGGCEVIVAIY